LLLNVHAIVLSPTCSLLVGEEGNNDPETSTRDGDIKCQESEEKFSAGGGKSQSAAHRGTVGPVEPSSRANIACERHEFGIER
jgi:hypothetical protein